MVVRQGSGGVQVGGTLGDRRSGSNAPTAQHFTDNFHRANAGDLGAQWVNDHESWGIESNQALCSGSEASEAHVVGFSALNVSVTVEVVEVVGNAAGPMLRWNGPAMQGYVVLGSADGAGNWLVFLESIDGPDSSIIDTATVAGGTILTLKLTWSGSAYTVECDGVTVLSGTDTTWAAPGSVGIYGITDGAKCASIDALQLS